MRRTSTLLFVGLLVAFFAATQAQKHANIDYLSFGYDIFRGNPYDKEGVDPGFRFARIFDLTYDEKMKSSDGYWDVPDSVTMARTDACKLNFESNQLETMASYQQSLEREVSVSGGFFGASFKVSTDYKSMEKSMTTTKDKHMISTAVCNVYKARMDAYDPPKLHPKFIKALTTLSTDYDEKEYFKFLDYFGTHAVTEISMGARYGMISKISEEAYNRLSNEKFSITAAASFSVLGISGSVDNRNADEKNMANKYRSAMTSFQIISVGAKPVAGGDHIAWAEQTITQPMPLRYTLIPLSELLDPLYVRDSLETSRMKAIRTNIQTALKNYCSNSLVPQGLVSDCNRPSDFKPKPTPPPPKINSCRWCTRSCGGNFPVDGGAISVDRSWPRWSYTWGPGCSGSYQDNSKGTENGIHLCCQQVDSIRTGQCKICNTCGENSDMVGRIQVWEDWDTFTSAYDNGCQGSLRTRKRPPGGFAVCCPKNQICSLCNSCGGAWPHEAGVIGYNWDYPDFFRGRGWGCQGDFEKLKGREGMKWCCKTRE